MRIAVLNKDKCKYKDCNYLCVRLCPMNKRGGKTIVVNPESQNPKPEINEAICTGCGICANRCPAEAIHIINLPDEIGTPIHQYGKNGFRIFNLPSPKKGVVGIIGKNGIGKSTTLKILSGEIIPDLSYINKEANWGDVIKYFKGKELQKFFLKISKNELNFSYKPQFVEGIRKIVKGKVRDVIKYDDKNFDAQKRNLLHELNINFLDNNVEELSGGELQKLAIYACLSKDADIYLLDEPSSYLDVEERLNLAKVIGGIIGVRDKFIILVEHDLALLDYLSDYIYVIFGKSCAYGIISDVKSTRIGINEYLDGFLKAENMRFRDSIKFEVIRARNREISVPACKISFVYKKLRTFQTCC
ncbi:conserved hypothetical protein [groundwater metagenome]|uniref:Ribosome biogenesis/translation initiation ATPase RLI n=1 Tax=groundwater metagenome TaxID=717931 RepID=A0A098E7H4_9ZZZZ